MEKEIKRPARDEEGGGRAMLMAMGIVLLPVAYLLSAGPVEWLVGHGYVSWDNWFVRTFYYPGALLMRICPPLNDFVRWYLSLWK